ncbi:zinc ribbon domain protein [bacterium BMS3Abin04]|nr:zinc ribbon domain protein [bacterium BMS3Abin04]
MPTYEYKCLKCMEVFEVFQKMSDPPIEKCPKCGSEVKRLIGTGAGIVFKGSGFYETDYKHSHFTGGGETKTKELNNKETSKTETKPKETKDSSDKVKKSA